MLLNLSNHPSSSWPENQKQKALEHYAEILDIPFPAIDPGWSEMKIAQLASEYSRLCLGKLNAKPCTHSHSAAHIMGELTFCFAVVSLLQKKGVRCVASTTVRIANQNGKVRISEFSFVRFREYPDLENIK